MTWKSRFCSLSNLTIEMIHKETIQDIDEIIHQKVRLGIMSILAAQERIDFVELKDRLGLTDGNLSSHTSLLEKNQLLTVKKAFHNKKPKTTLTITRKGREALRGYLKLLTTILNN
jgi:DNA-binding MarR family transcriptional regulator